MKLEGIFRVWIDPESTLVNTLHDRNGFMSTEGPVFPVTWTFITFTIDAVGTVESLEDSEAIQAAEKLVARSYGAYVSEVCRVPQVCPASTVLSCLGQIYQYFLTWGTRPLPRF